MATSGSADLRGSAAPAAIPGPTSAASGPGRKRRKSGPQPFDFRRPNKVSREHVRALQIVNETFARQFTTVLSTTLRTVAAVSLVSVDHMTYDEYIRSTPNPSFLTLLSVEPLPGAGILQLPLPIAMTAIDRLLGGPGDGEQPARELTDIEVALLRDLVQRVLHELDYAFESLGEVRTSILQVESNPQFAQISAPSDNVVVAGYEIRIGAAEAVATLCLPLAALQPMLEAVASPVFADRKSHDGALVARALSERLTHAPVDVSVRFSAVTLTSGEILDLQVGDVLPLRHPVNAPLTVLAAGQPCALAVPGSKGRRLAFLVVPPASEESAR